jgi:hypothetical protein
MKRSGPAGTTEGPCAPTSPLHHGCATGVTALICHFSGEGVLSLPYERRRMFRKACVGRHPGYSTLALTQRDKISQRYSLSTFLHHDDTLPVCTPHAVYRKRSQHYMQSIHVVDVIGCIPFEV